MAQIVYVVPKSNFVALESEADASDQYKCFVKFLNGSHIKDALLCKPTLNLDVLEDFWATTMVEEIALDDGQNKLQVNCTIKGMSMSFDIAAINEALNITPEEGKPFAKEATQTQLIEFMDFLHYTDSIILSKLTRNNIRKEWSFVFDTLIRPSMVSGPKVAVEQTQPIPGDTIPTISIPSIPIVEQPSASSSQKGEVSQKKKRKTFETGTIENIQHKSVSVVQPASPKTFFVALQAQGNTEVLEASVNSPVIPSLSPRKPVTESVDMDEASLQVANMDTTMPSQAPRYSEVLHALADASMIPPLPLQEETVTTQVSVNDATVQVANTDTGLDSSNHPRPNIAIARELKDHKDAVQTAINNIYTKYKNDFPKIPVGSKDNTDYKAKFNKLEIEFLNMKKAFTNAMENLQKHIETSISTNSKLNVMYEKVYTPEGIQKIRYIHEQGDQGAMRLELEDVKLKHVEIAKGVGNIQVDVQALKSDMVELKSSQSTFQSTMSNQMNVILGALNLHSGTSQQPPSTSAMPISQVPSHSTFQPTAAPATKSKGENLGSLKDTREQFRSNVEELNKEVLLLEKMRTIASLPPHNEEFRKYLDELKATSNCQHFSYRKLLRLNINCEEKEDKEEGSSDKSHNFKSTK
ncbi:hypothetical protein POM88_014622 [Heracleum sosnowskyi]|uniref:Uncharacterized protein n=1 Tax=Heracleum sosnowskyi TaxID=360622 RepID=A0AAD8IK19_9APIA|nr:hypothetical protein POM88_014622 [Heracleum sosnowskyi]